MIPSPDEITLEWILFLGIGAYVGYKMRHYMTDVLDPRHPWVGFDWGMMLGAGYFYSKIIQRKFLENPIKDSKKLRA